MTVASVRTCQSESQGQGSSSSTLSTEDTESLLRSLAVILPRVLRLGFRVSCPTMDWLMLQGGSFRDE